MNEMDFPLDVKALDGDGAIEGLAAGYGNVDYGGDVMLPGSVTKSIQGRKSIPMLMFHDQKRPVGAWTEFQETGEGLLVKGRFAMSTMAGKEAHAMTKDGALGGLSVGYNTLRDRVVGKARHLIEVALHEVSLVTIPMNSKAIITSVKDIMDGGELPTVREFEGLLRDAGFSIAKAKAISAAANPHLRREVEDDVDPVARLWAAMRTAPIIDMTGE